MSEPVDRPATIEDVAKLAGVSIATVSRALRSPEKVAESTRKKVTAAIARTGYTANAMAQNLRMQRSQMVLVLASAIADPNFAGILTGLEKAANDRGYGVLIGNTEGTTGLEQNYLRFLSTGMADGLVLLTGHIPVAGEPQAPLTTLPPIVATERPVANPEISYVGVDDVAASKMATEYLISLGHRRITFISGGLADIRSDLRHSGYQQGLKESPENLRDWRVEGDGSSESGRAAVERLFIKDDLPTAFFCFNDNTAIGVISALQLRGYRVPEDFSVLGFDDIPFANNFTPGLTTIRQPRHHIGELAMNILLDRLANKSLDTQAHLLHGDLVVRESCAGVSKSRK
ncbi:MAG: LacI family DNA-binding transcriptional regulator [Roseibium sp.]|uniref:LacI family DNA-binding transcriptional regulator n=1 Tax=Roseibium sp. TaxID=1936156 RepID=UPI001B17465E|nr:LacI family DNA-binding transcriptional regulator [Roseibium sp.]MBO6508948.1 LacI family DNA-binding transcriptional regulator [Roseibium sp.]MBO6892524.1 LacI family DNA-binding transcriptional regulator [Roseibium sp.]MBO6932499.1 LacI family DNA-binding transcriptional regulator [Roseibium sp.]